MKYVLLVLMLALAIPATALAGVPDDLQAVSVTIKAGRSQGSGTLVTRKVGDDTITFVWTAGHVVDSLRTTRTVISPTGTPKILVEYKDAEIVQERQQNGRAVGEVKYTCKVVKVSDADYGEDLAVLMVRCKSAYPLSICAKFQQEINYIPPIGIELSHCGSLLGQFGANSYTTGVLSQTGRMLPMKGANVKVFDQVTAVAFPGSSGGGMFLKQNGEYVGMLTQGVMQLQGFNFIVPVRRIHTFAKDAKIEWAINPAIEMPTLKEIEAIPVEDACPSPGGYPQRNPAGGDDPGAPAFKPPFNFDDAINWVKKFVR
jgi:hypothetical protein